MDRFSSVMLRSSLVWLVTGVTLGGLMLVDRAAPGDWRRWAQPTHGHILFVGWFIQFAIGVAYWLLPRRRVAPRPLGYRESVAFAAVLALNGGLLLRVIAEPAERAGHATDWTLAMLAGSSVLHVAALIVFAAQLWPRLGARPTSGRRERPESAPATAAQETTR